MHITIRHSAIRIKTGAIGGALRPKIPCSARTTNAKRWHSGLARGTYGFDTSAISIYNSNINRSTEANVASHTT